MASTRPTNAPCGTNGKYLPRKMPPRASVARRATAARRPVPPIFSRPIAIAAGAVTGGPPAVAATSRLASPIDARSRRSAVGMGISDSALRAPSVSSTPRTATVSPATRMPRQGSCPECAPKAAKASPTILGQTSGEGIVDNIGPASIPTSFSTAYTAMPAATAGITCGTFHRTGKYVIVTADAKATTVSVGCARSGGSCDNRISTADPLSNPATTGYGASGPSAAAPAQTSANCNRPATAATEREIAMTSGTLGNVPWAARPPNRPASTRVEELPVTVTRIGQRARIRTKAAPIRLVANTTTDIADAVSGPNEPNAMKAIARMSGK